MSIVSHLPVVSPAQSGSMLRALALTPGQTVEGRVLGPGVDGATMVQVGRQAMSLSLPAGTQVGSIVTLGVQQAEGHLRLALVSTQPPPTTPQQATPATSVEISQRPQAAAGPLTYSPPAGIVAGAATAAGGAALGGAAALAGPAAVSAAGATPKAQAGAPIIAPPGPPVAPSAPNMQRPGAAPYGMPGLGTSASVATPVAPSTVGGATPPQAAALAQMVQQALPAQGSIGAVTGMLAAVLGRGAVPEPVLKAARQLLDNRLVTRDGKVDAAGLKSALRSSGIFQEATLAQGAPASASTDTKSSLLAMRQGLAQWLGNQAQIAQISQLPPPLRNVLPRARVPDMPQMALPDDVEELGRLLLDRTEGALARVRLHQHASLPDAQRTGESQWSTDLPLLVGQQQTVLHMQIHHDGAGDPGKPEERGWQVRFAVNLPDLGEVGAQVSLRAQTAGVMLWADLDETAQSFEAAIDDLRSSLEGSGLKLGALVVRHGAPGDAHAHGQGASGQFLDATR